MAKISINLTSEEHKKIEEMATLEGKPIGEFMLERVLASSNNNDEEPARFATMGEFLNALSDETAQAIIDAEEGKNLIKYDSVEDFFNSLDDD